MLRAFRVLKLQWQNLSFYEFADLIKKTIYVSEPYLVYVAYMDNLENFMPHSDNTIIKKGSIDELEEINRNLTDCPWEFKCHLYDNIEKFFIAKNESGIQHISWIYTKNDHNRLLLLDENDIEIKHCFTFPGMRGKGFYPDVIRAIKKDAAKQGKKRLFMVVHPENTPSIRGIEKAGFQLIGKHVFRKFFGFKLSKRLETSRINHNSRSKIRNVAYVLTPIEFGGSERVSLNFIKAYDRTQFKITPILLLRPWEPNPFFVGELDKLGIEYLTIPVARQPLKEGKDWFRIFRCYMSLFSFLKEKKIDLIHTNGYFADILGVPLAKYLRIPHLATCHGFIDNDQNLKFYNRLDMFFLRFSRRVVCVADEIKEKLIQSGIPARKISTLINSVSVPEYSSHERLKIRQATRKNWGISETGFVLGYTGRLSEEKGLRFLFKAISQLVEKDSELTVLLVGDGPQRTFLEAIAKDLHIQDHIVFAGFQKDITQFLLAFDIFVLPSLTEGTPMAMLEAMSFGVPVIATKVGGIPKVITNGQTGVLIFPSDVSEIISAIIDLKKDKQYQASLSRAARVLIEKYYNLDVQVKKIEVLYQELL